MPFHQPFYTIDVNSPVRISPARVRTMRINAAAIPLEERTGRRSINLDRALGSDDGGLIKDPGRRSPQAAGDSKNVEGRQRNMDTTAAVTAAAASGQNLIV